MDMTEYPKKFAKGDTVKTAVNKRQEVQLKFAGFKQVSMDVTPTTEAPPASHVDRVNALTGADVDSDKTKAAPELTEAQMAKLPEAKDAEVVDMTERPARKDTESNTAPRR